MKCFYHADADGRCSAYMVRSHARVHDFESYGTQYIEINYGTPFPIDIIRGGEQVYIVDYSISPEEMSQLMTITNDITWIDHHKTAIEKYSTFPYVNDIRGIRCDGIAACMLTYCYLDHMTDCGEGDEQPLDLSTIDYAPMFLKYVADWDACSEYKPDGSRDFKYAPFTQNFMAAFNSYDLKPDGDDWRWSYIIDNHAKIVETGITMIEFRDGWAKQYCKAKGFETEFEGHKCFAMNLGLCNSEYFKSISGYEILMPFCFDGNIWTVSMYSTTVDVSEIAKKYGGGGHRGASGFQCKELPIAFKK